MKPPRVVSVAVQSIEEEAAPYDRDTRDVIGSIFKTDSARAIYGPEQQRQMLTSGNMVATLWSKFVQNKTDGGYPLLPKLPLDGYDLSGRDLRAIDFSGMCGRDVKFCNCRLNYAKFHHCTFYGVDFSGANLSNVSMYRARIPGAVLRNIRIEKECELDITDAEIRSGDFEGAIMYFLRAREADLRQCNLKGAYIGQVLAGGTDLQGVKGLTFQEAVLFSAHKCIDVYRKLG